MQLKQNMKCWEKSTRDEINMENEMKCEYGVDRKQIFI